MEDVVERLLARDLHLQGVRIDQRDRIAGEVRHRVQRLAQVQHEGLGVHPAQQAAHAVTLGDAPTIDDGDVAAQRLRLFQVVRGQDDGRAAVIDLAQELPHRAADLDIHAGGGLIQDQQPRFMHQRPRDHQAALHATGEAARHGIALVPQLQLLEVLLGAHARDLALDAVEPGLVDDDGQRRLEHVEVQFLRHHADAGLGGLQFPVDVVTEHLHGAARTW